MNLKSKRYTKKQREWCENYQSKTTFEPMMGEYEAGTETFRQAICRNVKWFEDWSRDAFLRCDKDNLSIA